MLSVWNGLLLQLYCSQSCFSPLFMPKMCKHLVARLELLDKNVWIRIKNSISSAQICRVFSQLTGEGGRVKTVVTGNNVAEVQPEVLNLPKRMKALPKCLLILLERGKISRHFYCLLLYSFSQPADPIPFTFFLSHYRVYHHPESEEICLWVFL